MLLKQQYFKVPLFLDARGEYNLNAVKEVQITDSFTTLDLNDRKCQDRDKYEDCTTKVYEDVIMNLCRCLPFNLRKTDNVSNKFLALFCH